MKQGDKDIPGEQCLCVIVILVLLRMELMLYFIEMCNDLRGYEFGKQTNKHLQKLDLFRFSEGIFVLVRCT